MLSEPELKEMKALALQGFATSRDEGPLVDEDEITIPVGTLTNLQAALLKAVTELERLYEVA